MTQHHLTTALFDPASDSLQDTHRLFAGLYDFSPAGHMLMDGDTRIQEINVSAAALLGSARSNLLGVRFADLVVPPERRKLSSQLRQCAPGSALQTTEINLTGIGATPTSVRLYLSRVDDSSAQQYRCALVDLTESARAASMLDTLMHEWQAVLENAFNGVALIKNGIIARCNRRLEEMFGYARGELIGVKSETLHDSKANWERTAQSISTLLAEGKSYEGEHLLRHRDGSVFWCVACGLAVDATDPGKGSIWRIQDITERKQGDEALRNAHARMEAEVHSRTAELRHMVAAMQEEIRQRSRAEAELHKVASELRDLYDKAPCGYHSLDGEGRVIQINETELDWLGYKRDEVVGKLNFTDFIVPAQRAQFATVFPAFKERGQVRNVEYTIVRKDGTTFPVLLSSTTVRDANNTFVRSRSSMLNITRRKQAEEALRESEERFKSLTALSSDWYWEQDANLRFTAFSSTTPRSAFDHENNLGKLRWELPYLGVAEETWRAHKEILAAQQPFANLELSCKDKEGKLRYISLSGEPLSDSVGVFKGYRGIGRDITVQKETEAALRESEARYRHLVEHASDIFYETDPSGHFTFFNTQAAFKILGYTEHECMGRHFNEMLPAGWREQVARFYRRQFQQKIPNTYLELPVLAKNGNEVWLGQSIQLVIENGRVVKIQAYCRDITERRLREHELQHSQEQLRRLSSHLESVRESERARIARELHDELGSVLTALKMDLSWIAKATIAKHKSFPAEKFARIIRTVDSAIQTTRKITTELRPSILDNLGLWAAIEWQAQQMEERLGINVQLEIGPHENDSDLDSNRATALFRIVQEALTNVARHANASVIEIRARASEDEVTIEVSDNGRGMDSGQLVGTASLGLLGMYERARSFGGETQIVSAPAGGTTVRVRVPKG